MPYADIIKRRATSSRWFKNRYKNDSIFRKKRLSQYKQLRDRYRAQGICADCPNESKNFYRCIKCRLKRAKLHKAWKKRNGKTKNHYD